MALLRGWPAVLLWAATGVAIVAIGIAWGIYSFLPGIGAVFILGAIGAAIRTRQPRPPGREGSPRNRARPRQDGRERDGGKRTVPSFLSGWYGPLILGLFGVAIVAIGIAWGIYSFLPGIGAVFILGAIGAAIRTRQPRPPGREGSPRNRARPRQDGRERDGGKRTVPSFLSGWYGPLILGLFGVAIVAIGIALGIYSFLPGIGAVFLLGAIGAAIRARQTRER